MKDFVIVTTTGDRVDCLRNCRDFVLRQTMQPKEWIIVDDGKIPIESEIQNLDIVTYLRREPKVDDPRHTVKINLFEAMKYIENKYKEVNIVIFEDDDYYHEKYVETYIPYLENYDLIGVSFSSFYNFRYKRYETIQLDKHSSYASSMFNEKMLPLMFTVCYDNSEIYGDLRLWREATNKYLVKDQLRYFIGMKALPGRQGQTPMHFNRNTKNIDTDYSILRRWLGSDIKYYERFINLPESKQMNELKFFCSDDYVNGLLNKHVLRTDKHGNVFLTVPNRQVEQYMNSNHFVLENLRWALNNTCSNIYDLKELFYNKKVYVVGKGQSINNLTKEDFKEDYPIICINDSIHVIDKLNLPNIIFSISQDLNTGGKCLGKDKRIIIHSSLLPYYKDNINTYVFTETGRCTILKVIELMKQLKAMKLILYGFDSMKNDDRTYYDGRIMKEDSAKTQKELAFKELKSIDYEIK